jgi:outer membrane receptor protein involved in Fe transport
LYCSWKPQAKEHPCRLPITSADNAVREIADMIADSNSLKSIALLSLLISLSFGGKSFPMAENQEKKAAKGENSASLFNLTLDQLMDLTAKVEVASLFEEQDLQVASSVSSISAPTWKMRGARRMYEVFDNEPGVMTYLSGAGEPAIAIRGYTTNFSSVRGLATMIDGVPLNTLSYGTALYGNPNWELGTLDKVEMLKGPGSAIYGSDAFHGVISLHSFESEKDLMAVEMGGGNPGFFQGNIKMSRGFKANRFRIDFSTGGTHSGDEGIVYKRGGIGPGRWDNAYDSLSASLKVALRATDHLTIKAGGYGNGFNIDRAKGLGWVAGFNDLFESGTDSSAAQTRFFMGTASIVYALPHEVSIEASGYRWKNTVDITGSFVDFIDGSFAPGHTLSNLSFDDLRTGFTISVKQPDNRYRLQWLMAYSHAALSTPSTRFDYQDLQTGEIQFYPTNPNGKTSFDGYHRTIDGIFGQTKWGVIRDKLYLLFGGRYDHYSNVNYAFTPRAGLLYLPGKTSALKFLYGRAVRAPVGAEIAGSLTTMGNKDLKPEYISTYEFVYMLKIRESTVELNTFLSDWKNGIFFEARSGLPVGYTSQYLNIANNRAWGIEGKISHRRGAWLFDMSGSWVRSRPLGRGADPDYFGAFPQYMLQNGITYKGPKGWSLHLNDRLYWKMREATADYIPHSQMLPPYWRTDFTTAKDFNNQLQLSLSVRNIFDRRNAKPSLYAGRGGIPEYGTNLQVRLGYLFLSK